MMIGTESLVLVMLVPALLGVAGLWVLFYGPWQQQCIDVARRELFVARDEIFLLFATSDLGVEHPSHRRLRHAFNLMIRYAHRVTWLRVVLYIVFAPGHRTSETATAVGALGNHQLVEGIKKCIRRGLRAIFRSMVHRSVPLLLLMALRSVGRRLGVSLMKVGQGMPFAAAAESIIVVAEREEETTASIRPRRADATV